jgi:hypothetical protein
MSDFKEEDLKPGFKYDEGKPMMSLLDPGALREIAKVMTYGAKKYSRLNWRKGMDWSRCADAALRHIFSWIDGEDKDPETGFSHLAHAACCLIFLIFYQLYNVGKDDRFRTAMADLESREVRPIVPNGGDIIVGWASEKINTGDAVGVNPVSGYLERLRKQSAELTEHVELPKQKEGKHAPDCGCYYCR